jgi:hypothetical protein
MSTVVKKTISIMCLTSLLGSGCASLIPTPHGGGLNVQEGPTPKECEDIDSSFTLWGGIAAGTGFLAGTGGVGTLATLKTDEMGKTDKGTSTILGISSLVVGTISAISVFVSQRKANRFSDRGCSEVLRRKI